MIIAIGQCGRTTRRPYIVAEGQQVCVDFCAESVVFCARCVDFCATTQKSTLLCLVDSRRSGNFAVTKRFLSLKILFNPSIHRL